MLSLKFEVVSAWFAVTSLRFGVTSAQFEMVSAWFAVASLRFWVVSAWFAVISVSIDLLRVYSINTVNSSSGSLSDH
jgi:hypothetical protein